MEIATMSLVIRHVQIIKTSMYFTLLGVLLVLSSLFHSIGVARNLSWRGHSSGGGGEGTPGP